jgi:MFS family permease
MLAAFLALNQTIIATALPTIGRYFGDFRSELDRHRVPAHLDGGGAALRKLSDIWGRRAMILAAIGLFVAGSAAAAAAPDMIWLIIGRGLQGIGGGGILPLCQSVIADVVAPRDAAATRPNGRGVGDSGVAARCSAASWPSICTGR